MRERSILAILVMLVASLGYVAVRYDRSTHPAFRQKLDDLLPTFGNWQPCEANVAHVRYTCASTQRLAFVW